MQHEGKFRGNGEVRREQGWICEWDKAQVQAGSYSKAWGLPVAPGERVWEDSEEGWVVQKCNRGDLALPAWRGWSRETGREGLGN